MPCSKGIKKWRKEYSIQKKEHPWASHSVLSRIASDHIRKGGK